MAPDVTMETAMETAMEMASLARVLVCAATRAEHDACRRGIEAALRSGPSRASHEMLLTGVGPVHAQRALSARLARGTLPDLVVSSGFAGALGSVLPLASWITAVRIEEWNGATCIPVRGVSLVEGPPELVRCRVLSSDHVVAQAIPATVRDPRQPSPHVHPTAVDMESAALAREATRKGVTFSVMRLISDTPAAPLPGFLSPFAAAMASTSTFARLEHAGRGLRSALANPHAVVQLVKNGPAWLRRLEEGWRRFARPRT